MNLSHLAKDLKCLPPTEKHVSTQSYLKNKKGKITNECTDGRTDFSAQLAHSLTHQGDHQIFQVNSTQTLYSPDTHQKGEHSSLQLASNSTPQTNTKSHNLGEKKPTKNSSGCDNLGRAPNMLRPWLKGGNIEESQTSIMTKIRFIANKMKQTKNNGGCCYPCYCSRLQCERERENGWS